MSDVWEEVGTHERLSSDEKKSIYSHLKSVPKLDPSPQDRERTERIISRLKRFMEVPEGSPMVTLVVADRKFDLWLSSDCWYSHPKQKYGKGIEELLDLIEKFLINQAT